MQCVACGKDTGGGINYCGYDCHVLHSKQMGGKVICPNGLPVTCFLADGTMMEHEHANHPSYMFPIDVNFTGKIDDDDRKDHQMIHGTGTYTDDEVRAGKRERHALIFYDGQFAMTLYECCYSLWNAHWGSLKYSSLLQHGCWKLDTSKLKKATGNE